MLLSLALALALAPPTVDAPVERTWRVELPLALSATAPASNVETTVVPWLGVRVGRLMANEGAGLVEGSPTFTGFDGALYAASTREGTPEVGAARTLAFAEGRALWAPLAVQSTWSALVPYGFAGASAGGGWVEVKAFDESRVRPLFTWGARAGAGAELRIRAITTRVELGAGLRDLRFELTSALSLGLAL